MILSRLVILILSIIILYSLQSQGYSTSNRKANNRITSQNRRSLIFAPSIAISLSFINAPRADALKPNNSLCGTGFFEHIYEYKCTAIGDIEDEGSVKEMSSDEVGLTDSLMGKLGLSLQDANNESKSQDATSLGNSKTGEEPKTKIRK
jgi:hypothetical protein